MGERTVVVTGANTGIGLTTASALAGQGWRVFVACRSEVSTGPIFALVDMTICRQARTGRTEWRDTSP